jgi:nucleotide-binding universal stress UspA family protein
VLDAGRDVALAAVPGLDVSTTLLLGSRVDALVRHTREAALLTVGAPPHGLAERLWTGSTVTGTAARVHCPVVIVPPGPVPARRQGRVVVGLKAVEHAEHLLGAAFAVARQTQADLDVVHAWRMLSSYDDVIARHSTTPEQVTETVRRIEDSMIDLRMAYPDVQVHVEVVHRQAAFALVERSEEADLLLISRPAHGGFVHYLGSTARAVIRDAACPIEVVPPMADTLYVEHLDAATALVP